MIKLRDSKFIKLVCLFLASTLMYISCSTDTIANQNGCSVLNSMTIDENDIINSIEKMLDYAKTVDSQEDYTTFSEFHQTLFGDGQEARQYVAKFEEESTKYQSLGFEGYISSGATLSESVKSKFIEYSRDLSDFLDVKSPDLNEFTEFINTQKNSILQSDFCDDDKQLMSFYLSASQGFANWYYSHYFSDGDLNSKGDSPVTLRGCNFFTGFLCGLLALIVGATVGSIATVILLIATITVDGQEAKGEGKEAFALLAGLALGLYVGINTYEWCCSLGETPEKICEAPTGSSYIQTDCNEFVYRVFGPSDYGTTSWNNNNTDPSEIITSTPKLRLSVPSFGDPSELVAEITCVADGSTVEFFDWTGDETFESDDNPFPLVWEDAPPTNATYIPNFTLPYFISVNTSSTDIFTYTWSITPPHTIDGGVHDSNAKIKFNSTGLATTTVIVLDNCTGISESISGQTQIQ